MTEEKRCNTCCRWWRQKLGTQHPKLKMKRHCEGLVHMYNARHANGKKTSHDFVVCSQGRNEWNQGGPGSLSSWLQWGNGGGFLLGLCWIYTLLFVLRLEFTMHISTFLLELISSAAEEDSWLHGMFTVSDLTLRWENHWITTLCRQFGK